MRLSIPISFQLNKLVSTQPNTQRPLILGDSGHLAKVKILYRGANSKIELFDCQESPLPLSIKQLAQFCSDFVINGSRHCVTHRSKYNLYKVY